MGTFGAQTETRGEAAMGRTGQPFTSGSWVVKAGEEERFIDLWTRFTTWSKDNAPGAGIFLLLRDADDPRRFLSFGSWSDSESIGAWKSRPEFQELFTQCRALCEDFEGISYVVSAGVG